MGRSALLLVGFMCAVLTMNRIGSQAMPAGDPVLLAPTPPGFQTPPEFPNQPYEPAQQVPPATMPAEVATIESNLQPSEDTQLPEAPFETNAPNESILIDEGLATEEPSSTITETNTDKPTTTSETSRAQENSHAINLPQPAARATLVLDALTPVEDILAISGMKHRLTKLQPGEKEADILESLMSWHNTIQSMSEIGSKTGLHEPLSSLSQEPQPAAAVEAEEQQQKDPSQQQQQVQTQHQHTLEDIIRDKRQMAARTCPWCGRIIVLG